MVEQHILHRKAAGLLVVRLGSNMRPPRAAEVDAELVGDLVDRYPIGGLIVFNGRWPETRDTLATLQRRAEVPLLVTSDLERGLGQQVHGAMVFPHLRAFGEIGDEDVVEAFARATAREALACGIHVTLAPVVDVNRNPDNPIISTRAFGEDTATVSRLASAFVRGARAEGLLTTAKHFPGHGNTSEDSHATLPTVTDERDEIEREDLPPFQAVFEAGAELVMTAHVAYPALDASGRPATLSRAIMTDLLRGELGFEGAVISDSLHMEGIREEGKSEADLAVEQINAGVDLLLDPEDPEAIIKGVADAVTEARLDVDRLDEALARAQWLRDRIEDRFGANVWTEPSAAVPSGEVAARKHFDLARTVAGRAVRIEGHLPFASGEGLLAVMLRSHTSPFDPSEQPLGEALRNALPGVDYHEIGPDDPQSVHDTVREAAKSARAVLLALVVKPAAWHAFGLPENLEALARDLASSDRLAVASLGDPRALSAYEHAAARILTFSDTPVSQVALANAIANSK